jgi:ssDNA-binding replication factor A large subunit
LFKELNAMSMKVKDLKPNANASLRVRVCAPVGATRKIQTKKGYQVSVCTFMVGDETGAVEFSAFGKDVMTMSKNVGKVIEIKDGWVKEWNEKTQISLGKSGTWEVVEDKSFPLTSEIMKNVKTIDEEEDEDSGKD